MIFSTYFLSGFSHFSFYCLDIDGLEKTLRPARPAPILLYAVKTLDTHTYMTTFILFRPTLDFHVSCVFVQPYVVFSTTLILVTALLGLELARDIKSLNYT
jgi:hypothetical protein